MLGIWMDVHTRFQINTSSYDPFDSKWRLFSSGQ